MGLGYSGEVWRLRKGAWRCCGSPRWQLAPRLVPVAKGDASRLSAYARRWQARLRGELRRGAEAAVNFCWQQRQPAGSRGVTGDAALYKGAGEIERSIRHVASSCSCATPKQLRAQMCGSGKRGQQHRQQASEADRQADGVGATVHD